MQSSTQELQPRAQYNLSISSPNGYTRNWPDTQGTQPVAAQQTRVYDKGTAADHKSTSPAQQPCLDLQHFKPCTVATVRLICLLSGLATAAAAAAGAADAAAAAAAGVLTSVIQNLAVM
jgi:hypothetical protein